jgi:hypothetical protein
LKIVQDKEEITPRCGRQFVDASGQKCERLYRRDLLGSQTRVHRLGQPGPLAVQGVNEVGKKNDNVIVTAAEAVPDQRQAGLCKAARDQRRLAIACAGRDEGETPLAGAAHERGQALSEQDRAAK